MEVIERKKKNIIEISYPYKKGETSKTTLIS